jgi:NifU-like protein involved in Fe-S cluster formation
LAAEAADVGIGEAGALDESAVTRLFVRVADGRVAEARFKVFGCSAAIASASLVAEWIEGASVEHRVAWTAADVVSALSLPPERMGVAELAVSAALQAIEDWKRKSSRDQRTPNTEHRIPNTEHRP